MYWRAGAEAATPCRACRLNCHSLAPLPITVQVGQWQVVVILLLKALSLERCPPLRQAYETREGIGRLNRLLGSLSFTSEEFYAALELICPAE